MIQLELFVERSVLFENLVARRRDENAFLEICDCKLWKHKLSPIAQKALALISSDRVLMAHQHKFEKSVRDSI
ncbi:hypothetical protein PS2_089 [Serratia phage PS2]|uniref:Uncharacterized protein n=1 Tax=Serratia phage PS2 TaxID=1481112 RepID=A0A023W686_9CAUD|nr:hypothetical protein FF83_gp089 [Serratia phage PS2]AHY25336.1 hypothetical protein PS2_089 [Serratia phage PS2]